MSNLPDLLTVLKQHPAVLVSVVATRGSVPRDAGTWMAVSADGLVGTIGGGRLEFDAEATARTLLDAHRAGCSVEPVEKRIGLGPSLGQCCGGEVQLRYELVQAVDVPALRHRLAPALWPVGLFGGGHVGQALVQVLALLPFEVTWVDSRDGVFPEQVPPHVHCEHSDPVHAAVADLPPGSRVLIMSFSHAEDLDIVAACLLRQRTRGDLPYIGLIGSRTKWAVFSHRLAERGFGEAELAHVTCPIGVPVVKDKRPEIIAVAVAAQLLQVADPAAPDAAAGAAGRLET
ncbi:MAG: xanthine dehydrogenase accessory protein XdhC [Rhodoferax sp.]|uniref:xanthine dehydrogenase accessory protein XdhC n=1 Tax=Rhodoferax sp. TaxID=50421 RepID=UPI002ACEFBD8|nr:xanthine dehydrogenase accessory protein XdhC [Rhodoferax sp.]MDZ7893187.1 xanthine dehydrogenase accessory protein XdhC [Rhodoferax sp.]